MYKGLRLCIQAYIRVHWPTSQSVYTGLYTGLHQCSQAYIRVYWPKPVYSGLQPCIQAYVRVDLPALIRVYSPASAYIGPHPCIPACKLASSRVTRAVYTGLHQYGLQPCYQGSVY